jgi:predicted thioredoxin/glutaredoxin
MTTNRNSWSTKEEQVLINILEKNKDYVLEYSFNLAAIKLNRSLSAIRQHYYYHKNKIKKSSLKKEFKQLVKTDKYKLSKKGNLFIVEI